MISHIFSLACGLKGPKDSNVRSAARTGETLHQITIPPPRPGAASSHAPVKPPKKGFHQKSRPSPVHSRCTRCDRFAIFANAFLSLAATWHCCRHETLGQAFSCVSAIGGTR